jgi:hypothetical protein
MPRNIVSMIASVPYRMSLLATFIGSLAFMTLAVMGNNARAQNASLSAHLRLIRTACQIQPYGDIGTAWRALPAPNPLGCALEVETGGPDGYGRSQRFEHGQITWSAPQRGKHALLIAYQAGNGIELQWTGLEPFNYDFFIVRTDKNGQNILQQDVKGERSAGFYVSHNLSPGGVYSYVVEGCDEKGVLGEGELAGCRQGWLNRVTVQMGANPIKAAQTLPDPPLRGKSCAMTPSCVADTVSQAVKVGGAVVALF